MTPREDYISRCRELGIKHKLKEFNKADRLARAYIRIAPRSSDPNSCSPYISIDIDGKLSYFAKVVDDEVIVRILTKNELRGLGY